MVPLGFSFLGMARTINLNADMGGFGAYAIGNDKPCCLSSGRNVACGFHAGDPSCTTW